MPLNPVGGSTTTRIPYFGKLAFNYDPVSDAYTCPQGYTLRYRSVSRGPRIYFYKGEVATCNACPLKAHCTPSSRGRVVSRSYDEAYFDRVRAYHATAPYHKAIRKRSVWVEPLFGEAKQWHGLRRFRLRRLWRVTIETLLTASGQNLKCLLSRAGWGRRPFPDGALASAWSLALSQVFGKDAAALSLAHSSGLARRCPQPGPPFSPPCAHLAYCGSHGHPGAASATVVPAALRLGQARLLSGHGTGGAPVA